MMVAATNTGKLEETEHIIERHLDWSDKQRRILTANGKAESYYTLERGFPFTESELPHFFLLQSTDTTRRIFQEWKKRSGSNPITGAWKRPLFYGGWENSTDQDERVFNVQTNTLFIDLRIPTTKNRLLLQNVETTFSLQDLTETQLKYYARQHIFAGYSFPSDVNLPDQDAPFDTCYTRHHCIDWNFVGVGRNRPNKWWVEIEAITQNVWKEWAYATDDAGQHYYCERWERLANASTDGPVVALRKAQGRDGVIVIVGDHFNYCLGRQDAVDRAPDGTGSLIELVDAAVERGDLETARSWLSIQGGHGTISTGWVVDAAIEFWTEGSPLWSKSDVCVFGSSIEECHVVWKGERWDVFECSLTSPEDLQALLWKCRSKI
jgi:hypothetical protein